MMPSDISEGVRQLRSPVGRTQEPFAHKLGVAFPTVDGSEHGQLRALPVAMIQTDALAREVGNQSQVPDLDAGGKGK